MSVSAAPVMTETPQERSWPYVRPKNAATLILIDRTKKTPTVLMGKRHGGHKFMPGKFVFPGGRLEPGDRRMPASGALHEIDERRLSQHVTKPSVTLARALAMAAIRETFEETGLLIGEKEYGAPEAVPEGPWEKFRELGVFPTLEPLHFVSRAITPTNRPKRFDTRFFAVDAEAICERIEGVVGPDSELTELVWIPLPEAKTLDLPPITQVVLKELGARIDAGFGRHLPVPFRQKLNGKWKQVML
ncbi:NUDIX hydrolase [Terrarubrum flagellatum]|uniref:NUDIX hydrolase n=1 Tax=Terrirubrum flagellatum TaxID=2895980 RepID=UPI003144E777